MVGLPHPPFESGIHEDQQHSLGVPGRNEQRPKAERDGSGSGPDALSMSTGRRPLTSALLRVRREPTPGFGPRFCQLTDLESQP